MTSALFDNISMQFISGCTVKWNNVVIFNESLSVTVLMQDFSWISIETEHLNLPLWCTWSSLLTLKTSDLHHRGIITSVLMLQCKFSKNKWNISSNLVLNVNLRDNFSPAVWLFGHREALMVLVWNKKIQHVQITFIHPSQIIVCIYYSPVHFLLLSFCRCQSFFVILTLPSHHTKWVLWDQRNYCPPTATHISYYVLYLQLHIWSCWGPVGC